MNSVEADRAGTASGINNAVARVAGVLAIAILGVVMVQAFEHQLLHSVNSLELNTAILRDIRSNAVKLGGLEISANLDAEEATIIRTDITHAFVHAFRLIMMICAALAMASAAVAAQMISPSDAKGP